MISHKNYLTTTITSRPEIRFFGNGQPILEVHTNKFWINFWAKNFDLNFWNIINLYHELRKPGVCIKVNGDYVEVGGIKFEGIVSSWESSFILNDNQFFLPKEKFRQ